MAHIAFLGAGMIGGGMVEAALSRGEQVTVWNRTPGKAEALAGHGARVAATPAEAVAGAERVHIALSDDAAVDAVLEQAAPSLAKGALVVDHTTTSPAGTAKRFAAWAERGVDFLHAPVFMAPSNARAATGLMLCAGPAARFERAKPALERMTGHVWWVGERPDLAAAYKLFGNAMIVTITGGLADVFTMAKSLGVGPEEVLGLFGRFNPAGVITGRGAKMAQGDFTASFEMTMARKDVRLMIEAAAGAPLSVLPSLAARMDALIAEGHGKHDMGALAAHAVQSAAAGDKPSA